MYTARILRGALLFLFLGSIISKRELVLIALVRIVSVNVIIIIFFFQFPECGLRRMLLERNRWQN